MRITILGATRLAVATIEQLIASGHEVILIDKDHERLDALAETLDCGMIRGDGTLPHTQRDAFGDGADAFVALTHEDNINILAAVVARAVGYPRVIPQISRTELLPIVDELGVGETITPHRSVAETLVAALEWREEIATIDVLKNELRLVLVAPGPEFEAVRLGDLDLPPSARGIARIRDGHEAPVAPDLNIESGDRLLLVVAASDREAVERLFHP
jgi:trk system potassium uptake protein TrkA